MKLTQKRRGFVLDVIKEVKPGRAYMNHYKVKSMSVADACASRLLKTDKIQAYYKELLEKMEDETIASPKERKQILTEITRGNLIDYQEVGADGGYLNIGKESPNTRAISEITSRIDEKDSVIIKVKLHSPTQAIDLLNKMDKIYSDKQVAHQDNRAIYIIVTSEKAKELTENVSRRLLETPQSTTEPFIDEDNG